MKAGQLIQRFILCTAVMAPSLLDAGTQVFDQAMQPIVEEYLHINPYHGQEMLHCGEIVGGKAQDGTAHIHIKNH